MLPSVGLTAAKGQDGSCTPGKNWAAEDISSIKTMKTSGFGAQKVLARCQQEHVSSLASAW